jgi:hypothetical protein
VLHDYEGQYHALSAQQRAGAVDIELHGYTHMNPDHARWALAADRYDNVGWYRELGAHAQPYLATLRAEQHPLALGIAGIEHYFGRRPSTLICPGDAVDERGAQRRAGAGASRSQQLLLRTSPRRPLLLGAASVRAVSR